MKFKKMTFIVLAVGLLGSFGMISTAAESASRTGKQALQKGALSGKSGFRVTFVELGSVNCVPCKMMQPVMEDIEKEYGDQVKVVFHDVWTKEGSAYGKKYKVQAIPTQVFLDKDGKEFFRHMGYFPKEEIIKVLQKQGVE